MLPARRENSFPPNRATWCWMNNGSHSIRARALGCSACLVSGGCLCQTSEGERHQWWSRSCKSNSVDGFHRIGSFWIRCLPHSSPDLLNSDRRVALGKILQTCREPDPKSRFGYWKSTGCGLYKVKYEIWRLDVDKMQECKYNWRPTSTFRRYKNV